jgi:hypothetical protein
MARLMALGMTTDEIRWHAEYPGRRSEGPALKQDDLNNYRSLRAAKIRLASCKRDAHVPKLRGCEDPVLASAAELVSESDQTAKYSD